MNLIFTALLIFGATLLSRADEKPAAAPASPAAAADQKAMQGQWKPVESAIAATPLKPAVIEPLTLKIDGDRFEITIKGESMVKGTAVCDPSVSPKRLNITSAVGPNKVKRSPLAIYELKDGDTLRVCYDFSGTQYPADFQSLPNTEQYNVTYKRVPASGDPAAAIAALKAMGADVRLDSAGAVEAVGLDKVAPLTEAAFVHLKALTTVKTVSLRFTDPIALGLVHLQTLPGLTSLYLPGSALGDAGMEQIGKMPALVNLYVSETKITDAGLVPLKGLTTLRILYLDGTKVTDAGLAHLAGLTSLAGLYLRDTSVTDAGLEHLKGMSKLFYLDLRKTGVTDAGVQKMKAVVPACDIKK